MVNASDLMPLGESERAVTVTDRGAERSAVDRIERVPGEEQIIYRRVVDGFCLVDLVKQEDGSVAVVREVELGEARRVTYDPPLLMVPAVLHSGETVEATSHARVYDHESGTLQAEGEVTATYRLLDETDEQAGLNVDVTIQTDRRYRLPLTIVDMRLTTTYAPGEGPIAGRVVRTVKLLGLIPLVHEQAIHSAE